MKLIPQLLHDELMMNGLRQDVVRGTRNEFDFQPVVKLFTTWGACTWLLTEIESEDLDLAFGLCDLGMGEPELGYVRISELEAVRGPLGLGVERDVNFKADKTLSEYANEARKAGRIKA